MLSISSKNSETSMQTFYDISDIGRVYSSSTPGRGFLRVFTKGNKVSVYEYIQERSIKSNTLINRCQAVQIYELHQSEFGESYLTVHLKERHKEAKDISLQKLRTSLFAQTWTRVASHNFEKYMDEVIAGWFGAGYRLNPHEPTSVTKAGMLFPVFKDSSSTQHPILEHLFTMLEEVDESVGGIAETLRQHHSWAHFLKGVISPDVVQRPEDYRTLIDNTVALLPWATMPLGVGLAELFRVREWNYRYGLFESLSQLKPFERDCIRFMLQNLPAHERAEATQTVLSMADFLRSANRRANMSKQTKVNLPRVGKPKAELTSFPWNRVPERLRGKLARKLLNQAHYVIEALTDKDIEGEVSLLGKDYVRGTQMKNIVLAWFADNVIQASLNNGMMHNGLSLSEEVIEEQFLEMFGASTRSFRGGFKFMSLRSKVPFCVSGQSYETRDLFNMLTRLARNKPVDKGHPQGNSFINYKGTNSLISSSMGVYSLKDVMNLLEESVARIDALLRKQGIEATPDNRRAVLVFGSKESKLASTWSYFEMGVDTKQKLIALKTARLEEGEAKAFAGLPDEFFHELLQLHMASEDALSICSMEEGLFDRLLGSNS